jgi:hypothetical protein
MTPTSRKTAEVLITIDAPHFCAGIVVCNDIVTETAPIVHYMKRWDRKRVAAYCKRKGWKATDFAYTRVQYDLGGIG